MNKLLLSAFSLVLAAGTMSAETLFEGHQAVTWDNTLMISAEKFAEANVGDQIVVKVAEGADDVIELKANGVWLPGSVLTRFNGRTEISTFVTFEMANTLRNYGLELCGPAFTVEAVELNPTDAYVPENAVWFGYSWVDSGWNTLEVFKTAFEGQNPNKIIINFTDEAEDSTFILNVLTAWDNDEYKLFGQTLTNQRTVEIDMTALPKTLAQYLEVGNALMIQGHVESGNSFNINSVLLEPFNSETGIETLVEESNIVNVYNMMGVCVRNSVVRESATQGLPAGIYVVGNSKVMVRQ